MQVGMLVRIALSVVDSWWWQLTYSWPAAARAELSPQPLNIQQRELGHSRSLTKTTVIGSFKYEYWHSRWIERGRVAPAGK
jgi:hypothetical protein